MKSSFLATGSVLLLANFLSPSIALGSEAQAAPVRPGLSSAQPSEAAPAATEDAAAVAATAAAATEAEASKSFVADGQPMVIESLGVSITPPAGWNVDTGGSLSVVMSEPRDPNPSYDKPKYQRNITVAAMHRASPIDEMRATEIKEHLTKQFTADSTVSNFTIVEHKFFNYRGANDGLLVYSSLNIGEYPMMQMHVLVSGQQNQFLMSYTDLAERFSDATKQGAFDQAWNTMVSIEVAGPTPSRQDEYMRYGAIGAGALFLLLVVLLLKRRASKKSYDDGETFESDMGSGDLQGSMIATLAGKWRLNAKGEPDDGDDLAFSTHVGAKTRQTEYVSTY